MRGIIKAIPIASPRPQQRVVIDGANTWFTITCIDYIGKLAFLEDPNGVPKGGFTWESLRELVVEKQQFGRKPTYPLSYDEDWSKFYVGQKVEFELTSEVRMEQGTLSVAIVRHHQDQEEGSYKERNRVLKAQLIRAKEKHLEIFKFMQALVGTKDEDFETWWENNVLNDPTKNPPPVSGS